MNQANDDNFDFPQAHHTHSDAATALPSTEDDKRFKRCFAAALLVAAADVFFFRDGRLGWTVGAFAALLLAAAHWLGPRRLRRGEIACGAGLTAALLYDPGFSAAFLVLLLIANTALPDDVRPAHRALVWWRGAMRTLLAAIPAPVFDLFGFLATPRPAGGAARKRFHGWIAPLAAGAVFILLFADANPVIGSWVGELNLALFAPLLRPLRWFFWGFIGTTVWFALAPRPFRPGVAAEPIPGVKRVGSILDGLLGQDAALRMLVVLNGVFLVHNLLDARHLLFHAGLPEGMSFSAYTHRGVYTLIFTALLSGALMLVVLRRDWTPGRTVRGLLTAWVAQNWFVLLGSARRLTLYVDAYGLTEQRLYVAFWLALVAWGLGLVFLRIVNRRTEAFVWNGLSVGMLAAFALVAVAPVDRLIAEYNVRHCKELGTAQAPLDLWHLRRTGPAAIPALERRVKELKAHDPSKRLAETQTALDHMLMDLARRCENPWTWTGALLPLGCGQSPVDVKQRR